ncbi:hypothetical protein [Pyrobaculum sp.]|uniref:hypothetical protein n=1 Tax=Pyrobaculum sp. TaxID=2004705 RepID=UPI003164B098
MVKIALPAFGYDKFYTATGTVECGCKDAGSDASNKPCITISLSLKPSRISNLIKASNVRGVVSLVPVDPYTAEYAVLFDTDFLKERLCDLCGNQGVCGYVVYKDKDVSQTGWDTYFIAYLTECGQREISRRSTAIVSSASPRRDTAQKNHSRSSATEIKWGVVILDGINCNLGEGDVLVKVSAERFASQFIGVSADLNRLSVYPKRAVFEVAQAPVESGGAIEVGTAHVEMVYLGSIVLVKGRKGAFLPVVIRYDVSGDKPPKLFRPGLRYYKVKLELSPDDLYSILKSTLLPADGDLKPAVKMLMQNLVAGELFRSCGRWIIERELTISVLGVDVSVSTPKLDSVLKLYEMLYVDGASATTKPKVQPPDALRSLLKKWQSSIYELKRCSSAPDEKWIDVFVECLDGAQSYSGFMDCLCKRFRLKEGECKSLKERLRCDRILRQEPVYVAYRFYLLSSLSALMLGSHGVAHLMYKAVGARVAEGFGERIVIQLGRDFNCLLHCPSLQSTPDECIKHIDGLYLLKYSNGINTKVEITTYYPLEEGMGLDEFSARLRQLRSRYGDPDRYRAPDVCSRAWAEECQRLKRAYSVLKTKNIENLDMFLAQRSNECGAGFRPSIEPPRDIFRFLLPRVAKKIGVKFGAIKGRAQYVWPRYIPSCSDGCQLCVLVPRGVCLYPPIQEELKASKRLAIKLLEAALKQTTG